MRRAEKRDERISGFFFIYIFLSVVVSFPVMSSNFEELDVSQATLISPFVLTFVRSFVRPGPGGVVFYFSIVARPLCLFFSFYYSPLSGRYCVEK